MRRLTTDEADAVEGLVAAVRARHVDNFKAVVFSLRGHFSLEQVVEILMPSGSSGDSWWAREVRNADLEFFLAMVSCLPDLFTGVQVHNLLLSPFNGRSLLSTAFEKKKAPVLRAFVECLGAPGQLEANQVAEKRDPSATFTDCAKRSFAWEGDLRRAALDILSYLLANYARPSPEDLLELSRKARRASDKRFKTCCLRAVASAANPFIPGMFLSVGLADAAEMAPEGEKRRLISLQKSVDRLLLEILERLPQTVRGFHRGMDGCCDVFEPPEYARSTDALSSIQGPLSLALERRQQTETYCNVPLVMDFLSRRFTRGLPNLRDTDGVLRDKRELDDLRGATKGVQNSLVLNRFAKFERPDKNDNGSDPPGECLLPSGRKKMLAMLLDPRTSLQGVSSGCPSLTWLPGAQFVAAGLVAKPSNYYRVPAMRMMLDLVVYLGLLVVFSIVVLFDEDGSMHFGESLVAAYIVAGCLREGREVWRDTRRYFEDRWNIIDVLGLLLLAAGLIFRFVASSSQWGRALYALSAPLFFSRVLFFAQILRFQGPMVKVIFSMTAELARFGIVMGVIMLGFAISFHALFRDHDSFGETILDLFKAMLGDVDFFYDFSGTRLDAIATILFVAYLLIMTIMLLNLLVAILSTSHARVQENAEREYRVSKARIIQRYRMDVGKHLLPAPFNLIQLALACPFILVDGRFGGEAYTRAKEAVGRLVFWLVLGPLAVAAGGLLWMTSVLTFTFAWRKYYSEQMMELPLEATRAHDERASTMIHDQDKGWSRAIFMTLTHLVLGLWCLVGAPLCLLTLWLRNLSCIPVEVAARVRGLCTDSNYSQESLVDVRVGQSERGEATPIDGKKKYTIEDMLRDRPGGVGAEDLRKYIKDPMIDDEVRDDEKKRGVTVEHLKLLRNRLERTRWESQTAMEDRLEQLKRESAEIKGMLESVLSALGGRRPEPAATDSGRNSIDNGVHASES